MKKLIILSFIFIILAFFIYADQTVKTIEIPIGFGNNVPGGNAVFKTINLQLPDNINQSVYAVLKLTGDYLNNTMLIDMVNVSGIITNCTPTISSPNINVYNYHTEVDCSNAFSNYKGGPVGFGFYGNKTVTNIFGSLQLTYYNNPFGTLQLSGTEYSPGDPGTIFIQLRDAQGLPINNGNCYLNIYNPQINGTHSVSIANAPMLNLANNISGSNDGIYFYDLVVPSTLGIYMLSAKCSYNFLVVDPMLYSYPSFSSTLGTWIGSTIDSSTLDGVYQQCLAVSSVPLLTKTFLYYPFDEGTGTTAIDQAGTSNATLNNVNYVAGYYNTGASFNGGTSIGSLNNNDVLDSLNQGTIMFWAKSTIPTGAGAYRNIFSSDSGTGGCLEFGFENVAATSNVPAFVMYSTVGTSCGSATTFEKGVNVTGLETGWHNYAITVNTSGNTFYIDGVQKPLISTGTGTNLTRIFFSNSSSGTTTYNFGATIGSGSPWSGILDELKIINRSLSASEIQAQMAVRQTCDANYTFNMSSVISSNVSSLNVYWAGANTLSNGQTIVNVSYWNYNTNLWTSLTNTLALQGNIYTGIQVDEFLTNVISNVTGLISPQNTTLLRLQAGATGGFTLYTDWFDVRASISSGTIQDIRGNSEMHVTNIPNGVWINPSRNLTYYAPASVDVNSVSTAVWNYTNRTLTLAPENITAISIAVWNYTNRSLTFYPTQLDLTNYSFIVTLVWNATSRNLTYYAPASVDVNSVSTAVWNYTTGRNLTYYQDMTNYSQVANSTWNYQGNVTTNILTQLSTNIWNYVARYVHGVLT